MLTSGKEMREEERENLKIEKDNSQKITIGMVV